MTGADAVALVADLQPAIAIPAHDDGWSHFRDDESRMRAAIRDAPTDTRGRFRWLPDGTPVDFTDQLNIHNRTERNES